VLEKSEGSNLLGLSCSRNILWVTVRNKLERCHVSFAFQFPRDSFVSNDAQVPSKSNE
jgi:hypothetical protein